VYSTAAHRRLLPRSTRRYYDAQMPVPLDYATPPPPKWHASSIIALFLAIAVIGVMVLSVLALIFQVAAACLRNLPS
jgi:hypothetical protein